MKRLDTENVRVLILSAGKIEKELEKIFGSIPSGLIPLNGKPVIFRIIDKLLDEGFRKISITVGYKKEIIQEIISKQYKKKVKIEFISTEFQKPPGSSVKTAMNRCTEEKLLIILGDTLIENNLTELINKKNSFVLISQKFEKPENWCVITHKNEKLEKIFDKEKNLNKNEGQYALVGVYYFDNMDSLKRILDTFKENDRLEISSIIKEYKIKNNISTELAKEWHDVGHIENYFTTKQFMLKARYFNSLQLDNSSKIVTKMSENAEKLINEIDWYKKIPDEISELIPKIVDSEISDKPFLKLEYVGLPTLAEIWLYSELSNDFWFKIIEKLFETLDKFNKYSENVTLQEYNSIYFEKTVERVNELINSDNLFKKIFSQEFIFINGKKFRNWHLIKDQLELKINKLFDKEDNCLIHGDLCFSNILYDSKNKNFKLIDPRGKWGHDVYGDIKYDVAKIRHSIVGGFDTITNGLYSAIYDEMDGIITDVYKPKNYDDVCEKLDLRIKERWDLDKIKIIEGLLFISMLPLHKDHFERQLALYSIGIQRLNEVLDGFGKND
jgi:dTDP-glucose pyrophosphorylase